MLARIAIALPIGAAVTAGLLYMMNMFIVTGHGETDQPMYRPVEFVRIERTETVNKKEQRPAKPEAQQPTPEIDLPRVTDSFSSSLAIGLIEPSIEFAGNDLGGIDMTASDGEYLPIVKVAPVYPMRARQRRLEGYVIVEFVVTSNGGVRDVRVVESSSPLFDQAAVDAALKFKYRPRVVDGTPIEVAGVQNRITFKLDV